MVMIKKIITCRLNITDVANQFCPDYKQMRINEFSKQYIGYCSHGMLVTKVIEVIKSSQIRANAKTAIGGMHTNISVLVEGIIYENDEIIPDAQISKITDTIAVASSKYASINLNIGRINILKVGDITPVIVGMSQYNKFTDKIAIAANVFVPVKQNMHITIMSGPYTEDEEIKELFARINYCKKELSGLPSETKKSVEYFNNLIYSYASPKKWSGNTNLIGINGENMQTSLHEIKIDNLYKEFANKELCVFLPETKYLDGIVYKFKNTNVKEDMEKLHKDIWKIDNQVVVTTESNKIDIYKIILTKYYKQLYTLLKLAETYPNKSAITKSSHIWKFYEMNRIK